MSLSPGFWRHLVWSSTNFNEVGEGSDEGGEVGDAVDGVGEGDRVAADHTRQCYCCPILTTWWSS